MCSCSAGCCLCSWRVSSVRLFHSLHVPGARATPSEDMRRHQHLITNDVTRFLAEYEVSRFPYAPYATRRPRARLAGQRGPRRNWPTRAFIGGLVFCMGSGWRVSTPAHTSSSPSVRRPQPVQARPHHLVYLHRQLPNTSLLRPARDLRRRVQETSRCNTRPLYTGYDVRHPCFGPELQAMAVL